MILGAVPQAITHTLIKQTVPIKVPWLMACPLKHIFQGLMWRSKSCCYPVSASVHLLTMSTMLRRRSSPFVCPCGQTGSETRAAADWRSVESNNVPQMPGHKASPELVPAPSSLMPTPLSISTLMETQRRPIKHKRLCRQRQLPTVTQVSCET